MMKIRDGNSFVVNAHQDDGKRFRFLRAGYPFRRRHAITTHSIRRGDPVFPQAPTSFVVVKPLSWYICATILFSLIPFIHVS